MKKKQNAIFKNNMKTGCNVALLVCNGIFENIMMPHRNGDGNHENSFSQVKTVEYTEWAYINLSNVRLLPLKSERNMRVKFLTSGISLFIVMI